MPMPNVNPRTPSRFPAGTRWAILAVSLALLLSACGDGGDVRPVENKGAAAPESFTFFDLGAGSRLTQAVRDALKESLGSDAIEQRGLVDLDARTGGLLQSHFDRLHRLNRDLNSDVGARVEHNITRLTYRYPWQKNNPFKFVQLVFSNYTQTPLYFTIVLKKEGSATVDALKEKYGSPTRLDDPPDGTEVIHWEKNSDVLIVSQAKDRFGEPEYTVAFYFVRNIEDLLATEKKEIDQREKQLKQAGKTAF